MADKKISPREAAIQVLKKAEELYKASTLSKAEKPIQKMGMSEAPPAAPMQKMGMSEQNPDEKADAQLGEKVEQDVQQHEEQNEDPASHASAEAPMKGHIKLAKFMGAMEAKRGQRPGAKPAAPAEGSPAAPAKPNFGKGM
jgi:hypothetical protein